MKTHLESYTIEVAGTPCNRPRSIAYRPALTIRYVTVTVTFTSFILRTPFFVSSSCPHLTLYNLYACVDKRV